MSVSTIVAMKDDFPAEPDAPEGWNLASDGEFTWTFERDEALPSAGGVVWTGEGTEVTVTEESETSVTFAVDAVGSDGRVVLSRLPYPGYAVEGAVQVDPVRGWLLTVDVADAAPGESVTVTFRPPAAALLAGAAALALLLGIAWPVAAAIRRRRA
jgi:hypothetical protein